VSGGPTPDTLAAAHLHERLMAFLLEAAPRENLHIILAALSYEIARIVATAPIPPGDHDAMLEGVFETMKLQIEAYRTGRLNPRH
jgi:hypothetical protein